MSRIEETTKAKAVSDHYMATIDADGCYLLRLKHAYTSTFIPFKHIAEVKDLLDTVIEYTKRVK